MRRLTTFFLTVVLTLSVTIPGGAEETGNNIKYGDYLDERVAVLGDKDTKGILGFPEQEMMYDFDSGKMPQGVTASKSMAEISEQYYLTPKNSLKWSTEGAGSSLNFECGMTKQPTGYDWRHQYYFSIGLFQEAMAANGEIRSFEVNLISEKNGVLASYHLYLHKEGWNLDAEQLKISNVKIDRVEVKQTAGPGGTIYLDDLMIYICNARQLRKTPGIDMPHLYNEQAENYPIHPLTKEEEEAFEIIGQRVLPEPKAVAALSEKEMQTYRDYYNLWSIQPVEETDYYVTGTPILYYHRAAPGYTPMNDSSYFMVGLYGQFCSGFEKLGKAYCAVQDKEQKAELENYVIDIVSYALTYSCIPDSWYGGRGFAEGCYYGRAALIKAGLAEKMAQQLKLQYETDLILYNEHKWESTILWPNSADDLYTASKQTMLSILIDADTPEKARNLYCFQDYMNEILLNYAPHVNGTLKPDGSLFHHNTNKYDYGWRQAWQGITNYVYWFSGTPFSPSRETLERVHYLADIRYRVLGMDGKGGVARTRIHLSASEILQLAKSGPPDGSLEINPYRAAEWMAYGGSGEQAQEFLHMGIQPADEPHSNTTLSYALTNVHRRSSWRVQTYASGKTMYFNEYSRPATLFFNLAGIMLETTGEHAAMLINPGDNIYGRDNFHPAPGYHFSRAPGVTAAEVADESQLKSPGQQRGSSDIVGGVSTKQGNGVFMVPFDSMDNPNVYKNTPAKDFRFKKTYFYFDDKIVCLGSNIGYGGQEKVTTGLFQEKMTENDAVVLGNGQKLGTETYQKIYDSDEQPWLTDNIQKGGYYLFPGQTYTLSRGEQTFLGETGDFVSAYINHVEGISDDMGKYAYIIVPSPTEEKMAALANSMKSEKPAFEIIRQDEKVHVVKNNNLDMTGYAFFDQDTVLDEGWIQKVSSPSTIMTKEFEGESGLSLAIADPNLRIDKEPGNEYGWSQPQTISIVLKGKWRIKGATGCEAYDTTDTANIVVTDDGNSILNVTCKDGLSYEYLLENIMQPLSHDLTKTITFTKGSACVKINETEMELNMPVLEETGIAVTDIAKIFNAQPEWDSTNTHISLHAGGKDITFTRDSKIAVIDNEIVILEKEAVLQDGGLFVPLSVMEKILKSEGFRFADTISYSWNDAKWAQEWSEALPAADEIFDFAGGGGGSVPETGRNQFTLPEFMNEGVCIFAAYKNGKLSDVQISDLKKEDAVRTFTYEIREDEDALDYSFKGFVFESLESMQPLLKSPYCVP